MDIRYDSYNLSLGLVLTCLFFQTDSKYAAGFANSCVTTSITCHVAAQITKFLNYLDCSVSYLDFYSVSRKKSEPPKHFALTSANMPRIEQN